MIRKIFITILLLLLVTASVVMLLTPDAYAAKMTQKQLVFRDKTGKKLSWTTLTSVTIQDAGTSTTSSVYSDRNGDTSLTNPIVSGLSDPSITFWSKDADYKVTATDGTYTLTADNLTGSDGWLVFPRYLQAMSSRTASDSQTFTFGTTSDWVAGAQDTGMDWTPGVDNSAYYIGTTTYTSDLFLYGGTANYDLQWDASRNHLTFRDNVAAGFGAGAASGTVDYTIKTAGSTGALIVTAVSADDAVQIGDGTIATDFILQNTTTATADIWWDDSTETLHMGVTNYGVDVKFWGDTAGTFALWDEDADEMVFDGADLKIHEGSQIELYHTDTVDWTMDVATGDRLLFSPALTNDTANVHLGDATNTSDLALFGATASTVLFDASGNEVIFDAYDISLQDADYLKFGDGDDFTVHSTTTKILNFTPAAASDDYQVLLGSDQTGVDLGLYGTTASAYALWDASANALWVEGSDIFLGDGDLLVFGDAIGTGDIKVYATGTDLIIDGIVAETGTVAIGLTDVGLDFKLWAATNAEGVLWDASDEALEFTGANLALDATSELYDAVLAGTKVVSGTPVTIVFRPDAAATLTWTVPTGYDLIVTDAIGWKTAGAGAHADDEWSLQHNDGSAANIFDKEELNTIGDKARILFDNLDDGENELEATETLDLVALENAANGCDGIIIVSGYLKTAD